MYETAEKSIAIIFTPLLNTKIYMVFPGDIVGQPWASTPDLTSFASFP